MDHESSDSSSRQNRSLGRTNSTSSSGGKLSFTFSGRFHPQLNRDVESENVSVAGDNGDRAFRSSQVHDNSSIRSVDNATDRGVFLDQPRSASLGKISNTGVRLRRFFSLPSEFRRQLDADVESEAVSQSGDIGDRALLSRRGSESSSVHFSINHTTENGVFPIPEDALLHSCGFWSRDPLISTTISPVSPLPEEIISPLSTDAILHKKQEVNEGLPPSLEYISCLIHLAVFGVLGVLTRYLLQKLFGPGVVGLTSDKNILYLDLPSNMLGSFLMGWFGVVFKSNISRLSDQLAIGITTGYLGSLTTFSGWNQKMLDLTVHGHWVFAVLGYLLGLFLAAYSIILGVETAEGLRWLIRRIGKGSCVCEWKLSRSKRHLIVVILFTLIWVGLWIVSGILEKRLFEHGGSGAQLWLGCFVGPFGVWVRWWLARLNGRGLGRAQLWKWIPFGTLLANVSAACIMAALATVQKAVDTKKCDTVASGIELGFLGCLSTVSTFIAEFNAMRQSSQPWRAYAYAFITFIFSFGFGTLLYSVPVWAEGYP